MVTRSCDSLTRKKARADRNGRLSLARKRRSAKRREILRAVSKENVEVVRAIHNEWARGNLRAGLEVYDQDIIYIPRHDLPEHGRYLGPDAIREWMHRWLDAWTDVTLTAEELIEAGDSVVVVVRQRGTGKQSGAPTELAFFQVWTFRGRSVIRIEQFGTKAAALEAVGFQE